MQIFTFELTRDGQARPAIATLVASGRLEAQRTMDEEFSRIFRVKFIRAADLPAGTNFKRIITVTGPDGNIFEKAF